MSSDDRPPRDDHFLEWKVGLFSVAAVLGLGGIYLERGWLTGAAILLLASAMSLRFLPGGAGRGMYADDDEDEAEGGQAADLGDDDARAAGLGDTAG